MYQCRLRQPPTGFGWQRGNNKQGYVAPLRVIGSRAIRSLVRKSPSLLSLETTYYIKPENEIERNYPLQLD